MNPAEIANLLDKEDVIFLLEELHENGTDKTEIAEKVGISRKTLYNLEKTKDITLEIKKKIVKYYIVNEWDRLYKFIESKLEATLGSVILDVITSKWSEFQGSRHTFQRKNLFMEIKEYVEKFRPILAEKHPEQFSYLLEDLSYYDPSVSPSERYVKLAPDSTTVSNIREQAPSRITESIKIEEDNAIETSDANPEDVSSFLSYLSEPGEHVNTSKGDDQDDVSSTI